MGNIEIHLVNDRRESGLLSAAGLPSLHAEPQQCGACGRDVGEEAATGHFVPGAVILDHHSLAFLCEGCLYPIRKALRLDNRRTVE